MELKGRVIMVEKDPNLDAAVKVSYSMTGAGAYGILQVTLPADRSPSIGDEIRLEVKSVNPL